jgi:tight adherence protein B
VLGYTAIFLMAGAAAALAYFGYPFLEASARRVLRSYVDWAVKMQEKMFQPVSRARVTVVLVACPLLLAAVGLFLSRRGGWVMYVVAALMAVLGWSLPRLWISLCWQRRLARFNRQLIDGLNLMANSLKSGLNLTQVIQVLVREMPRPISQEFGLVLSQEKLGLTIDEALEKMLDRVPSDDLSLAIHSILILRETGGDLSETFDTIAATIRERRKVEGKIRSMTAQGKTQGLLLILMPFALGGLLYVVNPGFLEPLFTTRLGWTFIVVMLLFQLVGALWIKKVVTIDV